MNPHAEANRARPLLRLTETVSFAQLTRGFCTVPFEDRTLADEIRNGKHCLASSDWRKRKTA